MHIGNKLVSLNIILEIKLYFLIGRQWGMNSREYEVTNVVHPGQDGNDLQTMQVTLNKKLPFEIS